MTEPDGMYGEEIRRALSAVADLVVPDGDGLDKIRQRTRYLSPAFAWFIAYATYLPRALVNAIRVPGSELILMARGESTVFKRLWAARRKLTAKGSSPQAWLRPVVAAAGALVMVAVIVLAVPRLHQTIIPTSASNTSTGASVSGNNGGAPGHGETVGASESGLGPGSRESGASTSPGTGPSRCPGASGSTNTGGVPPTLNSARASATQAKNARNQSRSATHCTSRASSHSPPPSSPGSSPGGSSSPGTPTSPAPSTTLTTPPPTGGGTPTPTTSAVTNSSSPTPAVNPAGGG